MVGPGVVGLGVVGPGVVGLGVVGPGVVRKNAGLRHFHIDFTFQSQRLLLDSYSLPGTGLEGGHGLALDQSTVTWLTALPIFPALVT